MDTGEVVDHVTTGSPAKSGTVWQQVDTWRDRTEAVLEASLPRYAHGDNSVSVSIPTMHDLVARIHADASQSLDWECEPYDLAVMRIDLVRDFRAVTQGAGHLRGLLDIPAVRATTHVYTDSGSPVRQDGVRHHC